MLQGSKCRLCNITAATSTSSTLSRLLRLLHATRITIAKTSSHSPLSRETEGHSVIFVILFDIKHSKTFEEQARDYLKIKYTVKSE